MGEMEPEEELIAETEVPVMFNTSTKASVVNVILGVVDVVKAVDAVDAVDVVGVGDVVYVVDVVDVVDVVGVTCFGSFSISLRRFTKQMQELRKWMQNRMNCR